MSFRVKAAALLLFALLPLTAHAQSQAKVITTCGTMIGPNYIQGSTSVLTMDPTGVLCTSAGGGGGGGLSVTDQAAFTQGVSQFTPNGGVFNDTATLSSGQQGTQRYTTKRAGIIDVDTTGNALYSAVTAPIPYLPAATSTTNTYSAGTTSPVNGDTHGNIYVAQGNPNAVTAGWPTIGGELSPDATGTFTNATQTTSITQTGVDGYGTAMISISGTYGTATGVFELSDDSGTTWYPVQGSRIDSCTVELGYTTLTNTNRVWTIPISGADQVRIRSTAVASGTVAVRISVSSAVPPSSTAVCGTITMSSQYPLGAIPLTASATGTTAATTATLAASASLKTYLCSYSIRANATAATTVTNTITGVVTATLSHIMWVAPAASGLGVDEQIFNPCVPSSAINTAIAVVSGAPGTGGNVSATATGYQAP